MKGKVSAFTILELMTIIAIMALTTIVMTPKVNTILSKPKELVDLKDLKKYEDVATILTSEGKDFTEDNINKGLIADLQFTEGVSNKGNSFNQPYEIAIIDEDNFKVTSYVIENDKVVKSKTLTVSKVNGNLIAYYDKSNSHTKPKPGKPKYPVGEMVLEINTTTTNAVFEVPAYGPYNLVIDWGDNTPKQTVNTAVTTLLKVPHTYTTPGIYKVRISGTSERIVYDGVASRVYITKILQFGNIIKSNASYMFKGCTNLTAVEGTLEYTSVNNVEEMFSGCIKLNKVPSYMFKGISIGNAGRIFYQCYQLKIIPDEFLNGCKNFKVPYSFSGAFEESGIVNISSKALNGYLGTSTENLFAGAKSLQEVPYGLFEGTSINNTRCMFSECSNLSILPEFLFKNMTIKYADRMFYRCLKLTTLPDDLFNGCSEFKVEYEFTAPFEESGLATMSRYTFRGFKGTSTKNLFSNAYKLLEVPEKIFEDTSIKDIEIMFSNCTNLNKVPEFLFKGLNITMANRAFYRCVKLTTLPDDFMNGCLGFDVTYEFQAPFEDSGLTTMSSYTLRGFKGTTTKNLFSRAYKLTKVPERLFDDTVITNIENMFSMCTSLNELPGFLFKDRSIKMANRAFYNCTSLTYLPDDLFNGCKEFTVTYEFQAPFEGSSVTTISNYSLRGFKGTSTKNLFSRAYKLIEVPSGLLEDTNITNVENMFRECKSLITLPSFMFNGLNISIADSAFYNCIALKSLPDDFLNGCLQFNVQYNFTSPFEKSGLEQMGSYVLRNYQGTSLANVFSNIKTLKTIDSKMFNETAIKNIADTFRGCSALTQVPELWTNPQFTSFDDCFYGATMASNYASIPEAWK